MPEYSQIQTYVKCDKDSYTSTLSRFKNLLAQIGFDEKYLADSFDGLDWNIFDDGFVYSGCNAETVKINLNGIVLNIRPFAIGWTPQMMREIKEPWLQTELLFYTEEITIDYEPYRIKNDVKIPLLNIMTLFSEHFSETGVYLTNEGTDGKPWYALLGCSNEIWSFDAAIIPVRIAAKYEELPSNFTKKETAESIYLIDKNVWGEAP